MLYKYNCFASFHLLIGAGSKQVGLQELVNLMQEEWMMQKLMSSVSNLGCAAGNWGNTAESKGQALAWKKHKFRRGLSKSRCHSLHKKPICPWGKCPQTVLNKQEVKNNLLRNHVSFPRKTMASFPFFFLFLSRFFPFFFIQHAVNLLP